MRMVVATKNRGKIIEIKQIFSDIGIDIISEAEAGIDIDVEENGSTFTENALIKAHAVAKACNDIIIADDSGLCVDALDGRPGIYSARYAGENASDDEKIVKLLDELRERENRSAKFVTAVAVVFPDGKELISVGEVRGHILKDKSGSNGFGYDPVFFCDEIGKSFAVASSDEKNSVSHRGRALREMYNKLKNNINMQEVN